jgi:hypothetical protein
MVSPFSYLQSGESICVWISPPPEGTSARNSEDSSAPRASRSHHQTRLDALNLLVTTPFPRSPCAHHSSPMICTAQPCPNLQPLLRMFTGKFGDWRPHLQPRLELLDAIKHSITVKTDRNPRREDPVTLDLAVDFPAVSPSPFLPWPLDLNPTVYFRSPKWNVTEQFGPLDLLLI